MNTGKSTENYDMNNKYEYNIFSRDIKTICENALQPWMQLELVLLILATFGNHDVVISNSLSRLLTINLNKVSSILFIDVNCIYNYI